MWPWSSTLYVTPDQQSLRDAEEREAREMAAQSHVVRHAARDFSQFWQRVDAALTGERKGSE